MVRLLLIFATIFFLFSCGNTKPKKTTQPSTSAIQQPTPVAPIQAKGEELYPSVPTDLIRSLATNCDYIDYSFDHYPVSMNRSEPQDIKHTLMQISAQPALINKDCPPIGRMLFYQKGSIALEARVYYSEGCSYFVFLDNQKPVYANFMTASGISFFKDVIGKFKKLTTQQ